MRQPCPGPLTLAALVAGREVPSRETLLEHLAACEPCRAAIADIAGLRLEPIAPETAIASLASLHRPTWTARPWARAAVAAALLLTAGGAWVVSARLAARPETVRSQVPVPGTPLAGKEGDLLVATGGDLCTVLGRSASAVLRRGSRLRMGSSACPPCLVEGMLWIEAAGEPVAVEAAGTRIEARDAVLLLCADVPSKAVGSTWVREADASEDGGAFVAVLSGSVTCTVPGREPVVVRGGQEALLEAPADATALRATLPWRGDAGWRRLPQATPFRLASGSHDLAPGLGMDGYVWEVVFRRLAPSVSVGVRFSTDGAAGRGWELPLGAPLADERVRVSVQASGGWIRLLAGSYAFFDCSAASLGRGLDAGTAGCGLHVMGGEVEVLECRWRPCP